MEVGCDGFRHISGLPFLRLNLGHSQITKAAIFHLQTIPLTCLNISYCRMLDGIAIDYLVDMPLTQLDIECCPKITNIGLAFLSKLPLTDLVIRWSSNITDSDIISLSNCPLSRLAFSGSNITDHRCQFTPITYPHPRFKISVYVWL